MFDKTAVFKERLQSLLDDGTFKKERVISSPQSAVIRLADGSITLNFCANNYLGLADSHELVETAKEALDRYGYGMS